MKFIAPKDLYFLFVIGLINVVDWFSSPKLKGFVISSIVVTAYKFSSNKKQKMSRNVTLAFNGKIREHQKVEIVKGAINTFWNFMFSWLESSIDMEEMSNAELCGLGNLHHALRNGNGVILWESNGFGNRILSKRILHRKGFVVRPVHGANHLGGFFTENSSATWVRCALINRFFENCERKFVAEIIKLPRSNSLAFTRILLNRLNQNAIVSVSADGGTGQKMIPKRFLGRSEFFSTGIVSLAKISGAEILPMFCFRENDGKIKLVIEKPIKVQNNDDREESLESSVADYINLLETYVRRYPEQYINWHLSWDLLSH
jgi:lauroyl/myristoyl acyltransferase